MSRCEGWQYQAVATTAMGISPGNHSCSNYPGTLVCVVKSLQLIGRPGTRFSNELLWFEDEHLDSSSSKCHQSDMPYHVYMYWPSGGGPSFSASGEGYKKEEQ